MLAICLEDQENGSCPAEFGGPLRLRGHERTLSDEGMQAIEGEALHAECSSQRTEADVPRVEPVLTMESLLWDGAGIFQHPKDPVEVKHHHLKWERARLLQE